MAATNAPTVASSPEVEMFGLVFPSRNLPHSGCPTDAHPSGSLAIVRMSDQPSCLRGQPSAVAIGSGIARTSGVEVIDSAVAGRFASAEVPRS